MIKSIDRSRWKQKSLNFYFIIVCIKSLNEEKTLHKRNKKKFYKLKLCKTKTTRISLRTWSKKVEIKIKLQLYVLLVP